MKEIYSPDSGSLAFTLESPAAPSDRHFCQFLFCLIELLLLLWQLLLLLLLWLLLLRPGNQEDLTAVVRDAAVSVISRRF